MYNKTCSFLGHRKIDITEELKQKLKNIIEYLIVNYNVESFLFGSKSNFNELCHFVVTQLKEKYPKIKRVYYTCKSEGCVYEKEKDKYEKLYSRFTNKKVNLLGFEEEVEHKRKYTAGRLSYVERNEAMINDSDFCIFYYNENYVPITQTNSGTEMAYNYAVKKKKKVINLFE